jgi:hypothetical protein
MAKVASLWVGGPLGKIQELCLASFVYYGHEIYLYVYDMGMQVPDGVIKLDANQILAESEIFYHKNQLAAFSDLFRYKMIKDTGLMWVDADTMCLTESFFEKDEIVFINENNISYAGGILKVPQEHPLIEFLYEESLKILANQDPGASHWSFIGPHLMNNAVITMSLQSYAVDSSKVNVFKHAKDAMSAWDPRHTRKVIRRSENAHCLTFFNGGLTMLNFNKNIFRNGSAIYYFYKKYMGRGK